MTDAPRFLVLCLVDPAESGRVPGLRAAHLQHVGRHRDLIVFGGVLGPPDNVPEGVCYLLEVASRDQAQQFVDEDPYVDAYSEVRIDRFTQRLPEVTLTGGQP